MSDKRYQVFVSSTYEDLKIERQEVMQALLALNCIPSGMELFPAADESQWDLIQRVIDDCDYYIVIVGGRYGSPGPGGVSYTEMEYDYAIKTGKPTLAFLHSAPENIIAAKTEKDDDGKAKLTLFKDKLRAKLYRGWEHPKELKGEVAVSISNLIKSKPSIGWIRANEALSPDAALEVNRLRNTIDDLTEQLSAAITTAPTGTESLSQGEDEYVFNYVFTYETGYGGDSFTGHGKIIACWNEVFGEIAPKMYVDLTDFHLQTIVNDWVKRRERSDSTGAEIDQGYYDFQIETPDFETIKIQLLSLGLLRMASHLVDDKPVWGLTPYGRQMMMTVKAVSKDRALLSVQEEKAKRKIKSIQENQPA